MPTSDVRIGEFDDTGPLELPQHWRTLLEDRDTFYDMLVAYEDTYNEIDDSEVGMEQVDNLGYDFPDEPEDRYA